MSETNALKGRDRATVRACNLNPAMWRVPTIPVSNGHEVRGIFGMYPARAFPAWSRALMPTAARQEHPEQPLTRAEAWTSCACSLQHRKLMVQDNKFEQEVKAQAEPRPHCRKPLKDPSRYEL